MVPHGHDEDFLGGTERACQGAERSLPHPAQGRVLTTSRDTLAAGLLSACRDRRKGNILGSVLSQQLTSRRTRTPLLKAATRSAVSSTGQYLGEVHGRVRVLGPVGPCRPAPRGSPQAGRRQPGPQPAHLAGCLKRVVGKYSITEA